MCGLDTGAAGGCICPWRPSPGQMARAKKTRRSGSRRCCRVSGAGAAPPSQKLRLRLAWAIYFFNRVNVNVVSSSLVGWLTRELFQSKGSKICSTPALAVQTHFLRRELVLFTSPESLIHTARHRAQPKSSALESNGVTDGQTPKGLEVQGT